jgi:transposase
MENYKIIGIDLAKTKFHLVALNHQHEVAFKKPIGRDAFFAQLPTLFPAPQTFAFEACGGAHYTAQKLQQLGHHVIVLKPKDVKPYAKARQKNDLNDALGICKAALDPALRRVSPKTPAQQEVAYLHKSRQNTIQQRIQRSNGLISALFEFGYLVKGGKSTFVRQSQTHLDLALAEGFITADIYEEMQLDIAEIQQLLAREKEVDQKIAGANKRSPQAQRLLSIPGIGPINASIFSNKTVDLYPAAKDFAASLGLVPRQLTTGGVIKLGPSTKQGDRYARTMLIQAARTLVMRAGKENVPQDDVYQFIQHLKNQHKKFNVICVAVANKLARIIYACLTKKQTYQA